MKLFTQLLLATCILATPPSRIRRDEPGHGWTGSSIYVPDDVEARRLSTDYGVPHDEYGVPFTTTTEVPFVPAPQAPLLLPLLVPEAPVYIERYETPVHDEYGPPALPPVHEEYGPPPVHEEYGPPPVITTTLPPTTTVFVAPYVPPVLETTTTTTPAPYPAARQIYGARVESHYDVDSGIQKSSQGILRQVAVQRPSHLGSGRVEFRTGVNLGFQQFQ